MTKPLRIALAACLVFSSCPGAVDAGLLGRLFGGARCQPASCCPSPCENACAPTPCNPCELVVVEPDCGCSADAVVEGPILIEHGVIETVGPTPVGSGTRGIQEGSGSKHDTAPTPPGSGTKEGSGTKSAADGSSTRAAAPLTPLAPLPAPTVPLPSPAVYEASAAAPLPAAPVEEALLEEAPAEAAPIGAEPAEPAGFAFDDPAPASEPPANPPAADDSLLADEPLFADQPSQAATPAAEDSLFGEPAEPAEPSDSGDGLFGDEPEGNGGGLFDDEPAPADDQPADDQPDDGDLFGAEPESKEGGIDLFSDPQEDDPFGALWLPGGLRSNEPRLWTDNSGLYRTLGRLASIEGDSVRLVQTGGDTIVVPLALLSGGDLDFVQAQQDLSRVERIARTAMR